MGKPRKKKVEPTLSIPYLRDLVDTLDASDHIKALVCCKGATHGLEGIWKLDVDAIPKRVEWAAYIVTMTGSDQLFILDGESWIEVQVPA